MNQIIYLQFQKSHVIVITDENYPKPSYWFHFPDYPDRHLTISRGDSITIPVEIYSLDNRTLDVNITVLSENATSVDTADMHKPIEQLFPDDIRAYASLNKITIQSIDMSKDGRLLKPRENFTLTLETTNDIEHGIYRIDVVGYMKFESLGGLS